MTGTFPRRVQDVHIFLPKLETGHGQENELLVHLLFSQDDPCKTPVVEGIVKIWTQIWSLGNILRVNPIRKLNYLFYRLSLIMINELVSHHFGGE